LVSALRDRVWAYLAASAGPAGLTGLAEELFALPRGDIRRLAAAHVGMLPETDLMLDAAERVLRELPSSVDRSRIEMRGVVRRPIAWRETQVRRMITGDRSIFVCTPVERRYDTPLARLVKLSLAQCIAARDAAALAADGPVRSTLDRRAARASRLQRHAKLRDVRLVRSIPAHTLRGAARFPGALPVVTFFQTFREAVDELSPASVKNVVTRQLLVPSKFDRLLELFVGFELIDAMSENGFQHRERRLLPMRDQPFARFNDPAGGEAKIWYQRPLAAVVAGPVGEYAKTLEGTGLSASSLRPDFIVVREGRGEVLLVEVKFTALDDLSPDRVGIKDAFAYLHDSQVFLEAKPKPRALVVAWNIGAKLAQGDVLVANQGMVRDALSFALSSWERSKK
jgi:hypothetical protein